MGLQTNFLRRNATYAWCKRLPVQPGGGLMQISQEYQQSRNCEMGRNYCVCRKYAYY